MGKTLKFTVPRLALATQRGTHLVSLPVSYHVKRVSDGAYDPPSIGEMLDFATRECALGLGGPLPYLPSEDGAAVPIAAVLLATRSGEGDIPDRTVVVEDPEYGSDGSITRYADARYDIDAPAGRK